MKRVMISVCMLCFAASAGHAQSEQSDAELARDLEGKRVQDMGRFCARSANRAGPVFSQQMVEAGRAESAILDCLVGPDGKATSCVLVERSGVEVGKAALRLACRMQVDVSALERGDAASSPQRQIYHTEAGWRVRMPVRFRVEN